MKTQMQLQHDVQEELAAWPILNAAEVGVSASNGVVTLTGHVGSFTAKQAAEKAAKRVAGVKAVANDLTIKLPASAMRDDTDIAQAALDALTWHCAVPEDRIQVTVANGWVTLEGEVDWYYQKDSAYRAIRDLTGIKGVTDRLTIKPRVSPTLVKEKIEAAFRRGADLDAARIRVEIQGATVTLRGLVRSWAEYEDAEWAAWSAPGVTVVDNRLAVEEVVELPPVPTP
jgi:osmotically-inducible protein OsmY